MSTDPNCWEEPAPFGGDADVDFAHNIFIHAEGRCAYCGGTERLTP